MYYNLRIDLCDDLITAGAHGIIKHTALPIGDVYIFISAISGVESLLHHCARYVFDASSGVKKYERVFIFK